MTTGETIVRATIWLAMAAWTAAIVSRGKPAAKPLWTIGLSLYILHILFAYHVFYRWNNTIAWDRTASQTAEVVGVKTGVGLLVNFAFAAILFLDLVQQWRNKKPYRNLIDALVLFMIVNGAIVFGHGPVRWFGILLLLIVATKAATKRKNSKPLT